MDLQDDRPPDRVRQIKNIVLLFFLIYFVTYCTVNKLAPDSDSLKTSEFKHNVSNYQLCTLILV